MRGKPLAVEKVRVRPVCSWPDTATTRPWQSDCLPTHSLLQRWLDKDWESPELCGGGLEPEKVIIQGRFGVTGPKQGRKLPSCRVLQPAPPVSPELPAALGAP